MRLKLFLLACLLTPSYAVVAEGGCPNGESPTGYRSEANPLGCVPDPQADQQASAQQQPRGRWETRWGAIAIGSTATGGGVGLARNMISKRKAEKAAMSQCKATGGGSECKVSLRYYNQCAVIAWGDKTAITQGAESVEIASEIAMQKCSNVTTNCKIYYTDCTDAVWIQ